MATGDSTLPTLPERIPRTDLRESGDEFAIDPRLGALLTEQRAANLELRRNGLTLPRLETIDPGTLRHTRLYRRDGSFRPARVDWACDAPIETTAGRVLTRVFEPPHPAGIVVHFHGGGWALGSIYEQDGLLAALATDTSAICISIDYPLAPETLLPDALTVAAAALAEVGLRHPNLSICILGESAGAHVALHSVLRLRGRPEILSRVRALALTYGIYDLSMTPSQRSWGSEFLGISTEWLEWFYALTLPGIERDARADPAFSPLYADLTCLPPLLLSVGTLDPLLDDSVFLCRRYREAGNDVRLSVYPEAPHGFNHLGTAMAAHCNAEIAAFLVGHLSPA